MIADWRWVEAEMQLTLPRGRLRARPTLRIRAFAATFVAGGLATVGSFVAASPAAAATKYCANVTPVSQRPTLYQGDEGWCVQELQARLDRNGYPVSQTHTFGPVTLGYVKQFQTTKALPATGVVDARTWTALIGGTQEIRLYTTAVQYIEQRGPNRTARVVLSFDDCPKSYTAFKAVVDAAAASRVTIVLAPTGDCQRGSTFSASYARSKGQVVIGHSNTHLNLRNLTDAQVLAQIDPASAASGYLRPPYGSWDARVTKLLASKGVRVWAWTRDTGDWAGASQAAIVNYLATTTQANDTVLAHMTWNAFNATALAQIKAGLATRGLALCQAFAGTTAPSRLPDQLPCSGGVNHWTAGARPTAIQDHTSWRGSGSGGTR